ncbi:MAG: serine/threonine protein kinase [Candidatus Altiarchaeales archaeon ex4484_96]|nr:MAG: serine/threonine protein kinase [Candidatus Altiarchaeales archaeon ex4484_96]
MKKTQYELRKIYAGVFDKSTLLALAELIKKNHIDDIDSIVSTGKESNVYHGVIGEKEIAVKIYAIEASSFKNMERYIIGDNRFRSWRNRRQLIYNWAQKEYKNLSRVYDCIECPRPHHAYKNILVMDFMGEGGVSFPTMKDAPPHDAKKYYEIIKGYLKSMYGRGLVHADFSEYNILNSGAKPIVIDLSTGVLADHPLAGEFLKRDVHNIIHFFKSMGVDCSEKNLLSEVKNG